MAMDPVCFMEVDEEDTRFVSEYKGRKFYFCTNFCKKTFEHDPEKYAKRNIDVTIEPGGASC